MVGLVTAAMTMKYSACLPCSTQTSPTLSITPFPSPVSAFPSAHPRIASALGVHHLSSGFVGWKQSFRSGLGFGVELKGREPQEAFVSASRARDRVCQAMADPSAMAAQECTFLNKKGLKLKGLLVDGGAGSKEVCILCHGFRSSKQSGTLSALATGLAEAGVSTFRFDFSGNGESEGKFAYGNYWQEVEDLRAAVEFLTSRGSRVVCVVGHSKGGNCVVLYASKYYDVPCVINVSGRFALEKGQCSVHRHVLLVQFVWCCRYLTFGQRSAEPCSVALCILHFGDLVQLAHNVAPPTRTNAISLQGSTKHLKHLAYSLILQSF